MKLELWSEIDILISKSKYSDAICILEEIIIDSKINEFQALIGARITNPQESVLKELKSFKTTCEHDFKVQAIYLEMNGFDINYDRWYFDFFAYDKYSEDLEDLDWLCDWQSEHWPEFEINGLEEAQEVFEWYHENEIWDKQKETSDVYDAAMLLIMTKFIEFMSEVARNGDVDIPILATAHDFDIIGSFNTGLESRA